MKGLLIIVALSAVSYVGLSRLESRGAESAVRATSEIYDLASRGRYQNIEERSLCGRWALNSLRLLNDRHGSLQSYSVAGSGAQPLGRPAWVRVNVKRNGQDYVDDVTLMDSMHPVDIVEYSKADYDAGRFDNGLRADKGPGAVDNSE